jgi:hypothetical protein
VPAKFVPFGPAVKPAPSTTSKAAIIATQQFPACSMTASATKARVHHVY